MTKFKLIAYEKEDGKVPVEEELQLAKDRRKDFIERMMKYENI